MGGVIFRQDSEEAFRRFREVGLDPEKYMGAFGQKEFFLDVENGKIDADTFCRKWLKLQGVSMYLGRKRSIVGWVS